MGAETLRFLHFQCSLLLCLKANWSVSSVIFRQKVHENIAFAFRIMTSMPTDIYTWRS